MGLINLRTNLKSLRFGNDTQGGGASGLPYIQTGLPEDSPAGEYLAGIARTSADWPLRGGAYWTVASTEDAVRISRFLTDFPKGTTFTTKQVQLQKSNPKIETGGLASRLNTQTYNLNANLLAQVLEQGSGIHIPRPGANANELGPDNPQTKYEYIVSHKDTNQNRLVALFNSKISTDTTGLSLDATLNKLGISATDDNVLLDYVGGPDSLYGDGNTTIFRTTNTKDSFDNYTNQTFLHSKYSPNFEQSSPTIGINYNRTRGASESAVIAGIPGLSKTNTFKLNKPANPFAPSIGFTQTPPSFGTTPPKTIDKLPPPPPAPQFDRINNRESLDFETNAFGTISPKNIPQQGYGPTAGDYLRPEQLPEGIPTINQFGNTMGYSKLLSSKDSVDLPYELQDFRSKTIDPTPQAKNYADPLINIETRLSIGSPGSRKNSQRFNINEINPKGQDKINLLPLYTSVGDPIQDNGVRDIIKFAFEVIDNDNPAQTVPLHFRAYVTNFSDNIGAEWNAQKYMGRGENFYTYQGFTREISFNLKVAAQSKQEMMPLYQKLNYLASSLHPDYSSDGFMRGNLHKLTIGEWLYRTPGVLKSMNVTIDDTYPWEIKYTEPETRRFGVNDFPKNVDPNSSWKNGTNSSNSPFEDSNSDADMMELPQVLSISFTFSPILNNLPKLAKDSKGNFTATPILISDHGNENFVKRVNDSTANTETQDNAVPAAISNPNVVNTPPVTTATNDVNQQPAAATTSTQAAPTDSWVPGSVYVSGNVTGPAGTALWEVNRAQQQGFFYWDVTAPDGSVSTGSPSSLVNNVINDAKIEATEAAGL
jgi:hypothetical protein